MKRLRGFWRKIILYKERPFEKEMYTLEELMNGPFTSLPIEAQWAIDKRLREVE